MRGVDVCQGHTTALVLELDVLNLQVWERILREVW